MSEKDRCLQVAEEQELKLRMLQRVVDIYESDISKLKQEGYFKDAEIKELKKTIRLQQIQLERGIS